MNLIFNFELLLVIGEEVDERSVHRARQNLRFRNRKLKMRALWVGVRRGHSKKCTTAKKGERVAACVRGK